MPQLQNDHASEAVQTYMECFTQLANARHVTTLKLRKIGFVAFTHLNSIWNLSDSFFILGLVGRFFI